MKKSSLLRAFALFTLILLTGSFAQAQIKITPVDPNTGSSSSSSSDNHQTVIKCNATTTCTINDKNELVNCVQKEEATTFVLEASKGTITLIKGAKRKKYTIENFENEPTTGTLELKVFDYGEEFITYTTITIFASDNLVSVQRDLSWDEYDDSWSREEAMSRMGGTMEIYDVESIKRQ